MNTPWQFLRQTEDDPDWSPLTSTTPLAENRYRLAVQNAPPNLEVDIVFTRITDGSSYLLPRKRRLTRQVNAQGFLLLSSFTHLEPGTWQIRCLPSVMAELLGQKGQAALEFTVNPAIQVESSSSPKEATSALKSFLEMQLPEMSPLPELSLTTHHFKEMNEEEVASLTPELEAISHLHYDHLQNAIPPLIEASALPELFSDNPSITAETSIPEMPDLAEMPETLLVAEAERQAVSSPQAETVPDLVEMSSESVPTSPEKAIINLETEVALRDDHISEISPSETLKYEKNYLVQVHYLDSNTSITIDVAILEDPEHPPCHLDLPNPAQMPRRLQLPLLAKNQVLPPKLSPAPSRSPSSIRFKKLEPYQKAS